MPDSDLEIQLVNRKTGKVDTEATARLRTNNAVDRAITKSMSGPRARKISYSPHLPLSPRLKRQFRQNADTRKAKKSLANKKSTLATKKK